MGYNQGVPNFRERRKTSIHIYFHAIENYSYIYFVSFLIFYENNISLYILYFCVKEKYYWELIIL